MNIHLTGISHYITSYRKLTYPVRYPGVRGDNSINSPLSEHRDNIHNILEYLTDNEPCESATSLKSILKGDGMKKDMLREFSSCAKYLGIKPIKKAPGYLIEKGVLLRYMGTGGDVVIPEGVVWISEGAFSGCTNVTSVTVPEGVRRIEDGAFDGCSGLKRISLPSTCGEFSLNACGELDRIDVAVSNSVLRVEGGCLITRKDACLVLGSKNGTIPAGVKTIAAGSFRNCKGLKSITIPSSVNSIESSAFWGCSGLEQIIVSSDRAPSDLKQHSETQKRFGVEDYIGGRGSGSVDNCVINSNDTMILGCKNSKIPAWVRSICGAFVGCSEMKKIRIPKNVEWIDEMAFFDCTELEQFDVAEDNPVYRGEGSFLIARETDTLVTCGKMAPLPERIAMIGAFAFAGRNELKELVIPDGVGAIDDYAFMNCKELTSVVIPASVVRIGRGAFQGCTKLTRVEIKSRTLVGGSDAFYGCSALSSVTIPKNLKGGYMKQKDLLQAIGGERFKAIEFTFTD